MMVLKRLVWSDQSWTKWCPVVVQRYIWWKKSIDVWTRDHPFPIDIDYMISDTLELLRPKMRISCSLEEATKQVADLEREVLVKLGRSDSLTVHVFEGGCVVPARHCFMCVWGMCVCVWGMCVCGGCVCVVDVCVQPPVSPVERRSRCRPGWAAFLRV